MDVSIHIEVFTVYLHTYTYTDVDAVHYMSSCIRQNWAAKSPTKKVREITEIENITKRERKARHVPPSQGFKALD